MPFKPFYIVAGLGAVAGIVLIGLFLLRPSSNAPSTDTGAGFQTGTTQTVPVSTSAVGEVNRVAQPQAVSTQTIFKIVDGPIAGATVIQTLRPTTTLARYVQQHNGHVFDLSLDSAGAVPRAISNTTIPGITRALWAEKGGSVILQYLDNSLIKTVYLGFPAQTGTTTKPVTIKFLPDGITDIAVSPSGARITYLLASVAGVDGYTAAADGSASKKVFSLPLSRVLISWPSATTLYAYSASAVNAPGIAFSINSQSGAIVSLLHAQGLTLTADQTLSNIVYQTTISGARTPSTFVRKSNGSTSGLSYDPYPEKCVWSYATSTTLYCAAPLSAAPSNYLDLWHQGAVSIAEAFLSFNLGTGRSEIVAVPGGGEGGVDSSIDTFSVSSDGKYLLFVRRGDQSLWGIRL